MINLLLEDGDKNKDASEKICVLLEDGDITWRNFDSLKIIIIQIENSIEDGIKH